MNAYEGHSTVDAGEPDAHGADPEASGEMAAISADRLEALGAALASRRDEWVSARQASGVEKRWKEDQDQFAGTDESTRQAATMMDSAEQGYPVTNKGAKPQRSTVFINITRPKTNTAIARVQNMLLPTDDRNFGLKTAPTPDLTEQAKQEALKAAGIESAQSPGQAPQAAAPGAQAPMMAPGQPPQPPQAPQAPAGPPPPATVAAAIGTQWPTPSAQAQLDVASGKAKAMQDEIDDQLQECQFNREARAMLNDTGIIGTGILKGPIVVNQTFKSWQPLVDAAGGPTVHVMEIKVEAKPASQRVDPWNFYPDPSCGDDVHAGMGVFEQVAYTSKQLRELAKQPGYLKEQIAKVLEEGPKASAHLNHRDLSVNRPTSAQAYECWEYWGEFEPEDLRSAGIDIPDGTTDLISGCVILVNETVIKGFLNPLDTSDLPYDVMNWEADSASPFGFGLPYLIRSAQKVMNAAWRQLMDDAGLSTGPQIVIDRSRVKPMDGKWEITGRKLWDLVEPGADVRTVFSSVEFQNHSEQLEKIIELALKFTDLESSVPQLEQGEHANAPDTLGGMIIQQNSTNIVLSRLTKAFDDRITGPHIGRYVDWNMLYNEKEEIKGDFHVHPRGTSALLVRDMQNQAFISLGQYMGNGVVSGFVNWEEWFKEALRAQKIDPATIMKTDAQIAAIAAQPPQATPEQIRANALLAVAQTRAKAATDVAGAKVQGELAYAHTEQQISMQNAQAKQQERQDELQLAMLKYAHEQKLSLDEVKAELSKTAMQETTKRQLAAAEIQMKANEGHSDRTHDLHMQAANDQQQQPLQ